MQRSTQVAFVPFGVAVVACIVAFAGPSTDDSFITLHFARNLVEGHGLRFGGGPPVEGFTSPLHLLVASATYLLPGSAAQLVKLKFASFLGGAAALFVFRSFVRTIGLSVRDQVVTVAAVAGSAVFAVASTNGLETSLAMLLVTALVTESLRIGSSSTWKIGLLASACILTRPDAVPVVAAILLVTVARQSARLRGRRLLTLAAWSVAPVLAYEVFRLVYFGQALPNTYYAKHMPLARSLRPGLEYFLHGLVPEFPSRVPKGAGDLLVAAVGLALVVSLFTFTAAGCVRLARRDQAAIGAAIAGQLIVCLVTGGESIGLRFLAPVWMLICGAFAAGVVSIQNSVSQRPRAFQVGTALFASLCALTALGLQWEAGRVAPLWSLQSLDDHTVLSRGKTTGFGALWTSSEQLLECAPVGSSVAYTEMGYAFWVRPDLTVTDLRGLVDAGVARSAPADIHTIVGVVDPHWYQVRSFVGQILTRRQPELVLSIEPHQPATALAGMYLRQTTKNYGHVSVTVYRRSDVRC